MDFELQEWQQGVLASCIGSFLNTLGVQLRILSVSLANRQVLGKGWFVEIAGWVLWLTGQGMGQVAIALAPATIASCIGFSAALLWNAFLAPIVLGERLTTTHASGVCLLTCGALTVTFYSSHNTGTYTTDEFFVLLTRKPFLIVAGVCYSIAALLVARSRWKRASLDVVSFAFLFAVCGATDLIVTKFTLQSYNSWVRGDQNTSAVPTALALGLFTTVMCAMHTCVLGCQAVSSRYGDALQNIPLFLGSGTILQVILPGTFFDEFSEFTCRHAAIFVFGLTLMLCGLFVASQAAPEQPPEDSKEEPLMFDDEVLAAIDRANHMLGEIPEDDAAGDKDLFNIGRKSTMEYLCFMDIERTNMCFGKSRQAWRASTMSRARRCHSAPGHTSSCKERTDFSIGRPSMRSQSMGH